MGDASAKPRDGRIATQLRGTGRALGDGEGRALVDLTPEEVFLRKWDADHGGAPPDELVGAFRELLRDLDAEAA